MNFDQGRQSRICIPDFHKFLPWLPLPVILHFNVSTLSIVMYRIKSVVLLQTYHVFHFTR